MKKYVKNKSFVCCNCVHKSEVSDENNTADLYSKQQHVLNGSDFGWFLTNCLPEMTKATIPRVLKGLQLKTP